VTFPCARSNFGNLKAIDEWGIKSVKLQSSGLAIVAMTIACAGPLSSAQLILAQQIAPGATEQTPQLDSPEARMNRRFPQKVRVGDLVGLPVLDDNDVTLGHVRQVVRSPQGKIKLIVSYSRWFGFRGRPVAVPIEVVAILGRQIASLDMPPQEYERAPTWSEGLDHRIGNDEIIRIALTRR
jgi:hypothetical protein